MAHSTETVAVRWHARPGWAGAVRSLAVAVPLLVSALATWFTARHLPAGLSPVRWWVVVIAAAIAGLVAAEAVARRAGPLAELLRLDLTFPDRAPNRLAVAWQAGRPRAHVDADGRGRPSDTSALLGILADLSSHDRATRGHAHRVRRYSELIGRELGLDGSDLERLRWAALLHDIGKVAVPGDSLNTHATLTEEDWERIHAHPAVGTELATPLRAWLGPWLAGITEHHERFDGQGYPAGRRGHDIGLAARVIAVADSYDAMTSVQSYRAVRSPWAARQELARGAGTQFDPEVVRSFLAISTTRLGWVQGPIGLLAGSPLLEGLNQLSRTLGRTTRSAVMGTAAVVMALVVTAFVLPAPPTGLTFFNPPRPRREVAAPTPFTPPSILALTDTIVDLSAPIAAAAPPRPRRAVRASAPARPAADRRVTAAAAAASVTPAPAPVAVVGPVDDRPFAVPESAVVTEPITVAPTTNAAAILPPPSNPVTAPGLAGQITEAMAPAPAAPVTPRPAPATPVRVRQSRSKPTPPRRPVTPAAPTPAPTPPPPPAAAVPPVAVPAAASAPLVPAAPPVATPSAAPAVLASLPIARG